MTYWTVLARPTFDFEFARGFVAKGGSYRGLGRHAWSNLFYLVSETDRRLEAEIFLFNGILVIEEKGLSLFSTETVAMEFEELCWIQENTTKTSKGSFGIDICHPTIGSLISNFICNHGEDNIEGSPNSNLLFDSAQCATSFIKQYYRLSRIEEVEPITDNRPLAFIEIGSNG